ncbi:MAG: cation diffusion facilitator family transporter [Lachnospiraceae bacterium]|jgi:cation diffusion facilitator family transporter|nr:cation diffusion facilitator family transporter [Lachnospiraceae bacterium]OLA29022.1 MAG: cation-efflux pump [Firmicutes bacterium CAG_194_44_15]
MITCLAKFWIRESDSEEKKRRVYGTLGAVVGIFLNICLFAGKYLAGFLSGSIAIMADAFNNLSDAGSSFISLIGFVFSGKKPDLDHPFGHGRIEYLAGLGVSFLILLMGVELAKNSVQKILHPVSVQISTLSIAVLSASILVKLYMAYYNHAIGKKIRSATMAATATDSLSDAAATTVVLLAMLFLAVTGINIDGYCGILVAVFILAAGIGAAKETVSPLLGQAPDPEFVKEIKELVMQHEEVLGIHDMAVHDYGPGRVMVSLHAEVSGDGNIYELHDLIDRIERELKEKLHCETVIHMDPIDVGNVKTVEMKEEMVKLVKAIDERLTIHDFRMVTGTTHHNMIFDVVIPADFKLSQEELKDIIQKKVWEKWPDYYVVIDVDTAYVY